MNSRMVDALNEQVGGARGARADNLRVKLNGLRGRARGAREEFVVKLNELKGRARGAREEFVAKLNEIKGRAGGAREAFMPNTNKLKRRVGLAPRAFAWAKPWAHGGRARATCVKLNQTTHSETNQQSNGCRLVGWWVGWTVGLLAWLVAWLVGGCMHMVCMT